MSFSQGWKGWYKPHRDIDSGLSHVKIIAVNLQGRAKFPTGGNADNTQSPRAKADPVRIRGRQYSLDGRRWRGRNAYTTPGDYPGVF